MKTQRQMALICTIGPLSWSSVIQIGQRVRLAAALLIFTRFNMNDS
jgi:hypothetical protein